MAVQITSVGAIQRDPANGKIKLVATVCDPGLIKVQIDVSWTFTADDTRDCELHFTESGSDSRTVCVTPTLWEETFFFGGFDDICPSRSGRCARNDNDYFGGDVEVNVGAGLGICGCTCVCGAVTATLECGEPPNPPDCGGNLGGLCGEGGQLFMTQSVGDLNHPEGAYNFSDSHSETDFSWSSNLAITIALI